MRMRLLFSNVLCIFYKIIQLGYFCCGEMTSIKCVNNPEQVVCNLIMFHHVGGNGNSFRFLVEHAKQNRIKLYLASLPGRNGRNASGLIKTVEEMVLGFAENIKDLAMELKASPYTVLFGHSLGAIVAFELARLPDLGVSFPKLILSAAKSPEELSVVNKKLNCATFLYSKDDAFLMEYIVSIGGLPKDVDPMFLQITLPTVKGDYQAFEMYQYKAPADGCAPLPSDCAVEVFLGLSDCGISLESILQWGNFVSGSFEVVTFENGSHFYFTEAKGKDPFMASIVRACTSL